MSVIYSGVAAFDAASLAAEGVEQVADTSTQAKAKAADLVHHRANLAAALANGVSPSQYLTAIRELGYTS